MRTLFGGSMRLLALSALMMTGCGDSEPAGGDVTEVPYITPEGEEQSYEEARAEMEKLEAEAGESTDGY